MTSLHMSVHERDYVVSCIFSHYKLNKYDHNLKAHVKRSLFDKTYLITIFDNAGIEHHIPICRFTLA